MNGCAFCRGKFGLVRREAYGRQFCSTRCKDDYQKHRQQHSRVSQFLQWLQSPAPQPRTAAGNRGRQPERPSKS
jgi:hypothetical protein